ncbi:MAG: glycoside hydrolase family 88 protein [Anaeroplasma bactoclasticum]|nr:glycoside hydrolase family 88 protein [Anaeroplasma bactoclasticum]
MTEELKLEICEYLNHLLTNSTLEKPLWNKEVLIGLKKPGWNYIDGCMMVGLMSLYQKTQDDNIWKYIEAYIEPLIPEDGKIKIYFYNNYNEFTTKGHDSDPCNEAKILFLLYDKTKKEKYLKAIHYIHEQILYLPRIEGNFWHKDKYPNQIWLDGLFMIQPFYAEWEKRFNHCKNYADIVYQLENCFKLTWEENRSLMVHGYDGNYKNSGEKMIWSNPSNGHSSIVWLRACGWYEMALVDCYEIIEDELYKARISKLFCKTIQGLLCYQDSQSKMFWQVVDAQNKKGNYLETSGSLMISYAILKGVRLGILDEAYYKIGKDIFNGVCKTYFKRKEDGELSLGGICIGAGLTASKTDAYAGTYEMYIERKVVSDDGKAIGPLLMAYSELTSTD